jgi:opacity protein-like surface antigen
MGLKRYLWPALTALLVCAAFSVPAQTVPAADKSQIFWAVGTGISGFNNPDYGHGHLLGGTLWIDYTLPRMPYLLNGLGLEVEARDLNYGRSATLPANLRQDVASGGVFYSWPRYRNFRPYAKYLMGFGSIDYGGGNPARYHDTRTVTSMGGGVNYRVFRNVWARADYEYQTWPDFYRNTTPPGAITPHGFTAGAMYHFGLPRSR